MGYPKLVKNVVLDPHIELLLRWVKKEQQERKVLGMPEAAPETLLGKTILYLRGENCDPDKYELVSTEKLEVKQE